MFNRLVIFVNLFAFIAATEFVPHASPLRSRDSEIRRSPLPSISAFAPLAKSLRPISTGLRRAPRPSPTVHHKPALNTLPRVPLSPLAIPQYIPVPVPVFPKELPTLAPHTMPTFTPIPGLPTLPTLTMPPSFQRLLGITTTTMRPAVEDRQEYQQPVQYSEPTYTKDLNTIRSRLPKFVRGDSSEKSIKAEDNADWIVPFH